MLEDRKEVQDTIPTLCHPIEETDELKRREEGRKRERRRKYKELGGRIKIIPLQGLRRLHSSPMVKSFQYSQF